jgi:hypothetical protein
MEKAISLDGTCDIVMADNTDFERVAWNASFLDKGYIISWKGKDKLENLLIQAPALLWSCLDIASIKVIR